MIFPTEGEVVKDCISRRKATVVRIFREDEVAVLRINGRDKLQERFFCDIERIKG